MGERTYRGQRLGIVDLETGEIEYEKKDGEKICIRSEKQVENDKYFSPMTTLNAWKQFVKVMDIEEEVLEICKEHTASYYALNIMKRYIKFNSGILVKKKKKYKIVDLADDMGITRQMASLHFNFLKENNLIAEVPTTKGMYWAINPNYYFRGEEVPEALVKIFENNKKKGD